MASEGTMSKIFPRAGDLNGTSCGPKGWGAQVQSNKNVEFQGEGIFIAWWFLKFLKKKKKKHRFYPREKPKQEWASTRAQL